MCKGKTCSDNAERKRCYPVVVRRESGIYLHAIGIRKTCTHAALERKTLVLLSSTYTLPVHSTGYLLAVVVNKLTKVMPELFACESKSVFITTRAIISSCRNQAHILVRLWCLCVCTCDPPSWKGTHLAATASGQETSRCGAIAH